jgi:autotransporter-associated beta strand protein
MSHGGTISVASPTNIFTVNNNLVGPGGLTKTGPGVLSLVSANNNYTGDTTLSAGTLRLTAAGAIGFGALNFGNNTSLEITNNFTLTNSLNATGSGVLINILGTSTNIFSGPWSGNGSVTFSNINPFVFNGSLSGFGGSISFGTTSANYRFNNTSTNSNPCTGSAAASFDLGTGSTTLSNLNGAGLTYNLGALAGGANTILAGRSSNSIAIPGTTYSIGANGSSTAFSGRIADGLDTVKVVKVGSGSLLLNGNNTYTGLTTVSAGTLGGTGVISGPVTISASGTLAPGASIGTLTVNNALTNTGTVFVEVGKNGATLTSDKIVGLTSVAYGGTLVVSNIGPNALVGGESFQLFNIGGSGNFTSITPVLTGGLSWSFNPATGILSVTGGTTQPTLNFVNNGTSLMFSWTPSTGFKLQSQTNSINVGLGSNWSDYPGGGTPPVNAPIDSTQGTVFFRLISTP